VYGGQSSEGFLVDHHMIKPGKEISTLFSLRPLKKAFFKIMKKKTPAT